MPGVLPGRVNSPGSMQLLALCLVTAGIAVSYDVLFGRTGLLSFGHALFVGAGAYTAAIALGTWRLSLGVAVPLVLAIGLVLPLLVGAIALRVKGIAFAMVTLAIAQAVAITAARNPGGLTGGEEGLSLNRPQLPDDPLRRGQRAVPVLAGAGVLRRLRARCRLADHRPRRACLGGGARERGQGRGSRDCPPTARS